MEEANAVGDVFGIGSEPPLRSQQTTQSQGLAHPDVGDAGARGRLSESAPAGRLVVVDPTDGVDECKPRGLLLHSSRVPSASDEPTEPRPNI